MNKIKLFYAICLFTMLFLLSGMLNFSRPAYAFPVSLETFAYGQCGSAGQGKNAVASDAVKTGIDLGCQGDSCLTKRPSNYCRSPHNPILDLLFAIIRLLSDGVGLVVIASFIIAAVQYIFSRGEPQSIAQATKRIQSSTTALIIFILAYALVNYVIPNGFFGQ